MAGVLLQREIIAGMRDRDQLPYPQHFMDMSGAAPTGAVVVDRYHIPVPFVLVVHQRVTADHSVRQMQIDMRPGRERWKLATGRAHQLVGIDALSFIADPLDPNLHHAVGRCAHTSYPKSAPSRARMNSAPLSAQDSSGGNRSETARTMNTSGSVTPFGLAAMVAIGSERLEQHAPGHRDAGVAGAQRLLGAIERSAKRPLWQAPSCTHSPGSPENQVVSCDPWSNWNPFCGLYFVQYAAYGTVYRTLNE